MLFGDRFTVYCENHTDTQIQSVGRMPSLYLAGNTLLLHYKVQPVNAVWANSRCLLWETYGTQRYIEFSECRVCTSHEKNYFSNTWPNRLMLFGKESLFTVRTIRNKQIQCVGRMWSLYLKRITLVLRYRTQPVNPVWGNIRCILVEPYGTHRYTVWTECGVCTSQETQ
jgi:hypothetical protein